jgi:hypothetical protein
MGAAALAVLNELFPSILVQSWLGEVGRRYLGAKSPFLSMVPSFVIETLVTRLAVQLRSRLGEYPRKTTWPTP